MKPKKLGDNVSVKFTESFDNHYLDIIIPSNNYRKKTSRNSINTRGIVKIIKIGQKYHKLTVIKELEERLYNEIAYLCLCSCGNKTKATKGQLIHGRKKSCGCLKKKSPPNILELTGQRFGKLTVIKRVGSSKKDDTLWLCKCDCGNEKVFWGTGLKNGSIVSCGCSLKEQIEIAKSALHTKHTVDGVQVPLITKKVRSDSQTGHKGITRKVKNGREYYEVYITVNKKRKYIGSSSDLNEAIEMRKHAENKYYGEIIKKYQERIKEKPQK